MLTKSIFFLLIGFGIYFTYYRPKLNIFNKFRDNPEFSNYLLIIESNSEFDKKNYDKFIKHLKLFLIYYSQSYEDDKIELMFNRIKQQHNKIMKYLNKMKFSIPNSMRRHTYMQNAIDNLDIILKSYISKVANRGKIQYINV